MFGKPVFLITDILIFGLVFVIVTFFMYAMRKPHLRKPWRQVVRNKAGVISMMVLLVYIIIAILDSMHFHPKIENESTNGKSQYKGEIHSVFDQIVFEIRNSTEKTYSAPFAAYLFAKETVQLEDGTKLREFPRLKWGGKHLINPEAEKNSDIINLAIIGIVKAFIA
ncbi:MAG: ABC transporter permease, partial [Gammaproteobacteria bacterium]